MAWGTPGKMGTATLLRRWRERTGRTFADLSADSGVGYRTIVRIAGGEQMSGTTAVKLAKATGISVVELVSQGR